MIISGKFNEAVVKTENIESGATAQIFDLLNTRMVENEKIVIMPNVCINNSFIDGYTQTFSGNLLDPDILTSDLYDGLLSICYEKLEETFDIKSFESKIKKEIPFGNKTNKRVVIDEKDFKKYLKKQLEIARSKWPELIKYENLNKIDRFIEDSLKRLEIDPVTFWKSLGTVGGGNHFISLGVDDLQSNHIWLFVHTGSRYLGYKIWKYWKKQIYKNRVVKEEIKKEERRIKTSYKNDEEKRKKEIDKLHKSKKHTKLPSRFLENEDDISGYLQDLYFAKAYAEYNRLTIANKLQKSLKFGKELEKIETLYNSIDLDDKIIRVGAVKAYENQKLVMLSKLENLKDILICTGFSNEDWNYSAPSCINYEDSIKNTLNETTMMNNLIDPILLIINE